MSKLPLRVRLALVFAVAMALVLSGAGWFVYERVGSDLSSSLDQQLRARAQDLSALVRRGGSLRATGGPLVEEGESFAELLATDGRVLDATEPIGGRPLLTRAEVARATRGPVFLSRPSVPGLDEGARMLAVPLSVSGRRVVLVAGASRENRAETLRSLRDAFLIGGPLALLLASLGGYVLAGAALRPIEAMRRRAAEISTSSLEERLPVPQARDEVSRLGETLNQMLTRIQGGLERERRFAADASHELRTPLALLKTELELALQRDRSPDELQATIRSAAESTERLARLAEDLLLLARAEQGRVPLKEERTDVLDVLHTVARRFAPRAEAERRELSVDEADPLVLTADPLRLEQALSSMVDNAFRHGGGHVTLSARARNGNAELHVVDEGAGFPSAFMDRAFERFSRADAGSADGSGLGLAIVETIARAHHGRANIANRPDVAQTCGCRFRFVRNRNDRHGVMNGGQRSAGPGSHNDRGGFMSTPASDSVSTETIVLIHGMWMTPLSWEHWINHYIDRGHRVLAPAWPGLDKEPEELRRDPSPLRGLDITEVVDHYDKIIRGLDRPPIIIGHSFGGLFAQLLLDRGLGATGVALGTGAPKGVLKLPYSTLRAAWPALRNPANLKKETPLTPKQFHWCFTNALSRDESDAVYRRYYIPGSARPFFQAGLANFNPNAATKVDYKNPARAPLLLVTGTEDRICPPSVNKSNFKQQRKAPSATDHKEFPGRSHFPGQDGWEEVADYVLNWSLEQARAPTERQAVTAPA